MRLYNGWVRWLGGLIVLLGCSTPVGDHRLYVFPDGEIDIFDIDRGHRLARTIALPQATTIRGVAAHALTHMLYIGGNGPTPQDAYVLKYDLVAEQVVWQRRYPPLVDSLCVTPDGTRLYVPNGTDQMLALDAASGDILASVTVSPGVHNTVCTLDGKHVYVGSLGSATMNVLSTADNTVARTLGPFDGFVRPFTIDMRERYVVANVDGLLGFDVADAQTGAILYRVSPPNFPFTSMPNYTQSHGVTLSPDGTEAWVVDQPYNRVHVFDVRGLPEAAPIPIADLALQGSLSAPGPAQGREGWLSFSRDGRYVYVGDAGDVIEARTRKIVAHLDALSNTRKSLEIDFDGGVPIWAAQRETLGGTLR